MKELRKSLTVAGSVGQMLGLAIAILLLTKTGRDSMAQYGWLNVLMVALSVFLVIELFVILVTHRRQHQSGASAPNKVEDAPDAHPQAGHSRSAS